LLGQALRKRLATGISLLVRTTTSNLITVRRLLVVPADPGLCSPSPEERYRLHGKRATMSMSLLLLSATAVGHFESRLVRFAASTAPSTVVRDPSTPKGAMDRPRFGRHVLAVVVDVCISELVP
jgi:hypothetical protein